LGRYCGLGGDGCGVLAEVGGDDVDFGSVVCNVVCGGWFSCEEGLIWLGLVKEVSGGDDGRGKDGPAGRWAVRCGQRQRRTTF